MTEHKYYWHIVATDDNGVPRLGYEDGREVKVGETLTVTGKPKLCEHGLHACYRLLDCLNYASGTVLCKVALGGEFDTERGNNKLCATERTVVSMTTAAEGKRILGEFARWCALQVAHLWDMPAVVREYLETGNEELRLSAGEAARAAARTAAGAAAGEAARAAAWAAAGEAARAAAWAAARAAAGDAARAAARGAARAAAGDAACDAARATYADRLEAMFEEATGGGS